MREILKSAQPAIENGTPVSINLPIVNTDRVVGTITGAELSRKYGSEGLPEDSIEVNLVVQPDKAWEHFVPKV